LFISTYEGEVAVSEGPFRLELDGTTIVSNRAIKLAFLLKHAAAVVLSHRETRVELDGVVVVGKCAVSILAALIDRAAIEIKTALFGSSSMARLKSASARSSSSVS
jgi:hypothetical protein